jgi:hypothetical protein
MKLGIYEILNRVNAASGKKEKIEELRKHNDNQVLKLLLKMSLDKGLRWKLPEGEPPYKPSPDVDQQGMLYNEFKKFYLFLDDPRSANVTPIKRENIFINLLEALHPEDAKIVLKVKDKKPLGKGITEKLVAEAFPGLLQ